MNKLKSIRIASEKTQEQVAHDLDVALGTYRNWEQGSRKLNEDTIRMLSKYFHVPSDMIIGDDEREGSLVAVMSEEVMERRENAMKTILENYFRLGTDDLVMIAKLVLFLRSTGSSRLHDAEESIF